jgi:hypothetical protein
LVRYSSLNVRLQETATMASSVRSAATFVSDDDATFAHDTHVKDEHRTYKGVTSHALADIRVSSAPNYAWGPDPDGVQPSPYPPATSTPVVAVSLPNLVPATLDATDDVHANYPRYLQRPGPPEFKVHTWAGQRPNDDQTTSSPPRVKRGWIDSTLLPTSNVPSLDDPSRSNGEYDPDEEPSLMGKFFNGVFSTIENLREMRRLYKEAEAVKRREKEGRPREIV